MALGRNEAETVTVSPSELVRTADIRFFAGGTLWWAKGGSQLLPNWREVWGGLRALIDKAARDAAGFAARRQSGMR